MEENYTKYYQVESIGSGVVGICSCTLCGAMILLDEDDAKSIHTKWHQDSVSLINEK